MAQNRTVRSRWSPQPVSLGAHPDEDDLPPCEYHMDAKPCRRLATHHFLGRYVCDEHLELMLAGREEGKAEERLWEARRMLRRAYVLGMEHLRYHLSKAVRDYEEDKRKAEERAEEARRKARDPLAF
jgi:hypothetical protein